MKVSSIVLAGLLLSVPSFVFSQVTPEKTDIHLIVKPGEKAAGSILIKNESGEDILLRNYFEDLVYPPPFEGLREARPLGSTAFSFGNWASVFPSELILPAFGKYPVSYTFNVPTDAKGGYYGVLLFERGSKASSEGGLGIDVKIRTAVRFFVEATDRRREGRIEDIALAKEGIQASLVNIGNVLLPSKLSWHIMDSKGRVVGRSEFERVLPPQESSSFTVDLPDGLKPGSYILLINCDFGENKLLVKEVDFNRDNNGVVSLLQQKD